MVSGIMKTKLPKKEFKMETGYKPKSGMRAKQKENAARKNGTWKRVICANVLVVSMGIKSMMGGRK